MLDALLLVLAVVGGAWLSISSMLWIYWSFKPHKSPSQSGSRGTYWVFVGAWLGFTGFFAGGFYAALFFIPRSWGGLNEDGEFVRAREHWAIFLGVVASLFVLWLLHRVEKLVEENQALQRKCDSMRGEARSNTETSNQPLEPTAGRRDDQI